jgi:hypothetical protein
VTPTGLPEGARVVAGPERVGSELRWRVQLADGRAAVLAALAPELARDVALRRRYVRDVARLRELDAPGVAPVLATGPAPDPTAEDAPPPWRLRLDPPGETLEAWLARRAPAPVDEACAVAAALAERVREVHERGAALPGLHPRLVVLGPGGPWLTDVGLARVDILSTRTAASLLLEGSPYAAPEQFRRTALDPRADLYALGVALYRALTGRLPRGDGPAFLAEAEPAPPSALRPEVPPALDRLVLSCLSQAPGGRPASARELAAALRGEPALAAAEGWAPCQACGAPLRPGQRLCVACGKVAVQFEHAAEGPCAVVLTEAKEESAYLARLADRLAPLAEGEVPPLNLVIGDQRMYSKAELERRHKLPLPLFTELSPTTAAALAARLKEAGFAVKVTDGSPAALRRVLRRVVGWTALGLALVLTPLLLLGVPMFVTAILVVVGLVAGTATYGGVAAARRKPVTPFLRLRAAPAALPASDPLVARLAALLTPDTPRELRETVGGLALAVQRLVDHRAAAPGARREIDALTQPVAPLVELAARQVTRLQEIDRALAELDEGALVRALAASEARGEPPARRAELLAGLDRLRALEDERAACFHRLLEAESLLRRAAELGLAVKDEDAEHGRDVAQALHALGEDGRGGPRALGEG